MTGVDTMGRLAKLVRRRFPDGNRVAYAHTREGYPDTVLWQVLNGDRVVWDASPAADNNDEPIPGWKRLPEAAALLHELAQAGEATGEWLYLDLTAEGNR